jgi:hypothetical protein
MAENLIPEVIPGMVAVQYTGADNKDTGERAGMAKNVFPIDAKDLIATGNYKLVDNGAVEAARLNANPMRTVAAATPQTVVSEVTGIGGELHVATDAKAADAAKAAGDHDGKDAPKPAPIPASAPAKK